VAIGALADGIFLWAVGEAPTAAREGACAPRKKHLSLMAVRLSLTRYGMADGRFFLSGRVALKILAKT